MLLRNQPCLKCPSSDAMQEYEDGFFCHSCHTKFFRDDVNKKRYVSMENNKAPKEVALPLDFVVDVPVIPRNVYNELCGAEWLSQYTLSDELLALYNIGYSPSMNRIILPHFIDGMLYGYQARRCDDNVRKYLTYGFRECVFQSIKWRASTNKVVLCEDIISAIKIGEVGNAFALLTTSLKRQDEFKRMLRSITNTVYIWMDPDAPGQEASRKLAKSLRSLFHCVIIKSPKDPKYYSTTEIQGYLGL